MRCSESRFRWLATGAILTGCFLAFSACTERDMEEPIRPTDSGNIDPNSSTAAGDPALGGGPQIDEPASAGELDVDDSDAPLGTLTDEPWGPPSGMSGDDAAGDFASPGTAPDSAVGPSTETLTGENEGDLESAFEDKPVYAPGQRSRTAPKVSETLRKKPKARSQAKSSKPIGTGKEKRWITAVILNVRSSPDRNSTVVRTLNGGTAVAVDVVDAKWARLAPGEYIRLRHLSTKPQRAVSDEEVTNIENQRANARNVDRRTGRPKPAAKGSSSGSGNVPKIKTDKPLGRPIKKSN